MTRHARNSLLSGNSVSVNAGNDLTVTGSAIADPGREPAGRP